MRLVLLLASCGLLLASLQASAGDDKKDGAEKKVSIKDLKYHPDSINIEPGDTVVWKNDDDRDHTVTADDESFDSGTISSGQTFKQKFEKKGKVRYHCKYHPRMKGAVVVGKEKD